jgi:hypothetical protein
MADVYEGAAITISATGSSSSEDGCFVRAVHDIALSNRGLYSREVLDVFPRSAGLSAADRWPLFQRAWVYQERKMSTRILHFGKQQLFWECNSRLMSESDLEGEDVHFLDLKSSGVEEDPKAGWRMVVQHYSFLKLTYEKDRLPAISAFVRRLQRLRQDDVYIAGMWKKTLRHDLCWYSGLPTPLARPNTPGLVIPSWSWISISGVFFHDAVELVLSPDDINITYNITGPAHVGQVSHASIHLKARFMCVKPELTFNSPFDTFEHPDGIWGDDGPPLKSSTSEWDFDYTTADPPIHTNETFISLPLSRNSCNTYFSMVLRELANKRFERVGSSEFRAPELSDESESAKRVEEIIASLPMGQFTIV